MIDPAQIESALQRVNDQTSFVQELLIDALGWPIDDTAQEIGDIAYEWTEDELRAAGLNESIVGGKAYQIILPGNPWGIFVMEFANPDVFTTGRGMTGVLRRVLHGLVRKGRGGQSANLPRFSEENLLFICNHDYERYRFAHFKPAPEGGGSPPMASFGWGPDDLDAVRTICEFNLRALEWPDSPPSTEAEWLNTWQPAFDVEKVTKRFYQDYAQVFHRVEDIIKKATDLAGDELRMFTQSLFNRLMFLRFIERKGWLAFPGQTGSRYLAALASAGGIGKRSLYASRLRPLFFEGLAEEGRQQSDAYGEVPLLNGGLFEESDLDARVSDIPDDAFASIISQGGLFYRYNFTVEESTPLDIEVAVDPEMLGKVFEELVTGRHESGSYYTPRPVVAFMCREALKGHLTDRTDAPESAIARLVDDHEVEGLTEAHASAIIGALDDLKAVDPACGSGAYLLGLLQELIAIRRALQSERLAADPGFLYDLKLHIISHNLYGVDIDPFATEIAKLRLWLSLSVEADEPVALPNLDFKIEAGDSLLGPCDSIADSLQAESIRRQAEELVDRKDDYILSRGRRKAQLRDEIERIEDRLADITRHLCGEGVIDWHVQFAEVFVKNGGFDIVLANPPYVRKENIPVESKPLLRERYREAITGRSDLYCSFYARAVELLRPGGMHVFICSSAWLDAEYGASLQRYLLDHTNVRAIYDSSVEKQFSTANVNTIISVLQKKHTTEHDNSVVDFVLFNSPFERASRQPAEQRVVRIGQTQLQELGSSPSGYVGDKWGGKYLRAPEVYKEITDTAHDRLVALSDVADIVGYIHDNNTGAEYPEKHVIWRVSDATCIDVTRNTAGVMKIGVNPRGNSTLFAPILFPRQHGLRHIVLWSHDGILGKEFYRIIPKSKADELSLLAQLNSTFAILQREILGIRGFGGGALKFAARDVGLFLVLPQMDTGRVQAPVESMKKREILHGVDELCQPDRQAIDSAIFDALGLDRATQAAVYDAVRFLLDLRSTKAKSSPAVSRV